MAQSPLSLSESLPYETWCNIFDYELAVVSRMMQVNRRFYETARNYLATPGAKKALLLRLWKKLSLPTSEMPPSLDHCFHLQGLGRTRQLLEIRAFVAAEKARWHTLSPSQREATLNRLAKTTLPDDDDWLNDLLRQRYRESRFEEHLLIEQLEAAFREWRPNDHPVSCRLRYEGRRDANIPYRAVAFKVEGEIEHNREIEMTCVRLLVTIDERMKRQRSVEDYFALAERVATPIMKQKAPLLQAHFFISLAIFYIQCGKQDRANQIVLDTIATIQQIPSVLLRGYSLGVLGSLSDNQEVVQLIIAHLEDLIAVGRGEDQLLFLFWKVHILLPQGNSPALRHYLSTFEQNKRDLIGSNKIILWLRTANLHFLGEECCDVNRGVDYLRRGIQSARDESSLESAMLLLPTYAHATTMKAALEEVTDYPLRLKVLIEMLVQNRIDEAVKLSQHLQMNHDPAFLSELRRYAPKQASALILASYTHPEQATHLLNQPPLSAIICSVEVMQSLNWWEAEGLARDHLREMKPSPEIVRWQAALGDISVMTTLAALPRDNALRIMAIDELARKLIP